MFEGVDPAAVLPLADLHMVPTIGSLPGGSLDLSLNMAPGSSAAPASASPEILFMTPESLDALLEGEDVETTGQDYHGRTYVWAWTGSSSGGGWGGGGGGGGGGDNSNTNDYSHGGDTSGAPRFAVMLNHTATCSSEDGAAVQIARTIMDTRDEVYGPTEFDWKMDDYATLVVRTATGQYGALHSYIYSHGLPTTSGTPVPDASMFVAGLIHNHPEEASKTASDALEQRYPSTRDWEALVQLSGIFADKYPGYNPSMWLLDTVGVLREFRLSERSYFDTLSESQRIDGVGLDGRERSQACVGG